MSDKPQNKKMIIVTRKLPEAVEARVSRDYHAHLNPDDRLYSADDMVELCQGAFAVIPCHTERFDGDLIARLPATVKAICNFSVGVDHVDLSAAKQKGIMVTNTPDVLSDATAEIAMLCLLGAARRGAEGDRLVRSREWKDWSPAFMVGTQVTGKTLGIIGMGRVGRVIARRARGFDMEIHYHNRSRLTAELEQGAIYHENLDEMLGRVDFLSLNSPATPETRGFFNTERIAKMKKGAIVINTARGALVDDEALIAALKSGHLKAAGLDVYNNEPDIHPGYRELANTFLLPHIGSATGETREAMGFRALDNLDAIAGVGGPVREPGDRVA